MTQICRFDGSICDIFFINERAQKTLKLEPEVVGNFLVETTQKVRNYLTKKNWYIETKERLLSPDTYFDTEDERGLTEEDLLEIKLKKISLSTLRQIKVKPPDYVPTGFPVNHG